MKRRVAIRHLLVVAGGICVLPACSGRTDKASIALTKLDISRDQEELLAAIADTIIPPTDTPGAKEMGSHLFVLKMLDDCYETEDQKQFIAGLGQLDQQTKRLYGKTFLNSDSVQRQGILEAVEKKDGFGPEVYGFYKIMKEKTLQGFMTSKYVVEKIVKYEMIPSVPYNGYYPVKNLKQNGRQS